MKQKGLALVFWAAATNDHKWLKTTETYSLKILEARSLKPRCRWAMLLPEALGENPSSPLPASGGSRHSLVRLPFHSHGFPPGVFVSSLLSQSSLCLSLTRILVIQFKARSGDPG